MSVPCSSDQVKILSVRSGSRQLPRLRYDTAWLVASQVANGIAQWGVICVLFFWGSPEILGEFSLATAITTPLILLAGLDLRTVQATDQSGEYSLGNIIFLKTAFVLSAICALSIYIFNQATFDVSPWLVILMAVARGGESLSDIAHGFFQQNKRFDLFSKSRTLRSFAYVGTVSIVFLWSRSLVCTALALAVMSGAFAICWDAYQVSGIREDNTLNCKHRLSLKQTFDLMRVSLPVGITFALVSSQIYIPRLAVSLFFGNESLGVYTVCSSFMLIGILLSNATTAAALPRLSYYWNLEAYKTGVALFRRLFVANVFLGLIIFVSALIFAPALLRTFQIATSANICLLITLMGAVAVRCLSGPLATFIRSQKSFVYLLVAEVLTTTSLIVWLIIFGSGSLVGIGFAVLMASISSLIIQYVLFSRLFRSGLTHVMS